MVRGASEELTHFLHGLHSFAVLARSSRPCALQKPRQASRRCLSSYSSVAAADPIKETCHQYCPLIFLRSTAGTEGPAKGFKWGQRDCRVTAMALAVALSTVVGSLAAGSTAGMSLGTLCMGRMLGPSSVSRIPSTTLW